MSPTGGRAGCGLWMHQPVSKTIVRKRKKLIIFLGNYDEDWFKSGAMNRYLLLDYALEDPWETIYFNDR